VTRVVIIRIQFFLNVIQINTQFLKTFDQRQIRVRDNDIINMNELSFRQIKSFSFKFFEEFLHIDTKFVECDVFILIDIKMR
jgi:hypothetical protein